MLWRARMKVDRNSFVRNLRRSFHTEEVTIDVENDYRGNGGTRLIERGRGYVKILVLYEEEIQWLQKMCWKERRLPDGLQQMGCLRGGRRTLICSRIKVGDVRKLELRLFAPLGRRQLCIPELAAGQGWGFFAEVLSNFVLRKIAGQPAYKWNQMQKLKDDFPPRDWSSRYPTSVQMQKTYLQAASIPKWKLSDLRSSYIDGKEKQVLVNFEDAVKRSFQMSRCLIGRIGGSMYGKEELAALKRWIDRRWKVPGGIEIKEVDLDTFLFIFPSRKLAEEHIGKHMFNDMPLLLDRWHSWSCCNRRGWSQASTWIRVIGLPLFLWDKGVFENIGDYCGGFLETANETIMQSHMKWVRLRIKGNGRNIPAAVKLKVGNTLYDCPIWVERSPWVEWISNQKTLLGGCRSSEPRKGVARDAGTFSMNVHAFGSQRDNKFNGYGNQKRTNKFSPKKRKVQWIKVGDKSAAHMKGHISNSINESQSSLNKFEILNSLNDTSEVVIKNDHHINIAADNEITKVMKNSDEEIMKFKDVSDTGEGSFNQKHFITYPSIPLTTDVPFREDQILDITMSGERKNYEPEDSLGIDSQSDCSFETKTNSMVGNSPAPLVAHDRESNEIIDCLPLASYGPDDWNWSNETVFGGLWI